MRELINLRKKREKHFLNPDGTITCHVYDKDIHYLKNGIYEEIDNTLVDVGDRYENKSNDFRTLFMKNSNDLVNVKRDEHYLKMYLNTEDVLHLDKINENIKYKNLKNNIDFDYKILSSKLKESIILNCRETVPETLEFFVETDLKLYLQENKKISAKSGNEIIFTIDAPFMIDARGNANYCVDYEVQEKSGGYLLKVILDVEWLKDKDTVFPVTVDPTIINGSGENVYDTYITSLEPNTIRNNLSMLKVGAEEDGDINRILLKFALPSIGTSYTIVDAKAYLNAYDTMIYVWTNEERAVNVHAINTPWDETTANWSNMSDKYDAHIETFFYPVRHDIGETDVVTPSEFDITSLVKKWYSGRENYGIMLKWNNETYADNASTYLAYSKTYDSNNGTALRPYLTITYMYQNGIIPYMDYNTIAFNNGKTSINNFNGNVTNLFALNKTLYGNLPINLNLVYNTCDAVLETFNTIGRGYKFNFDEVIKEQNVESETYLEYIDEDSSIHYLILTSDGYYIDEEGMNLKFTLVDGEYIAEDSKGNKKIYSKYSDIYRLSKIVDLENNEISITYTNNKITKISNSTNEEINIEYNDNQIVISSEFDTAKINKLNNLITSIETKNGITSFEYDSNNLVNKIIDMNQSYIKFEYYSEPYRLKKITHYGLNNLIGKSLNYTYNFNSTSIVDDTNMKKIITFDSKGRTLGTTLYDNDTELLGDAYGYAKNYIENPFSTINNYNITANTMPIKYVKNLLLNSSFEPSNITYNFDTGLGYVVNGYARSGGYSLKFYETNTFQYEIAETNDYTFSFYIKKPCNGTVKLYSKVNDVLTEVSSKELIDFDYNIYTRYSVSGEFEAGSTLVLTIDIESGNYGYIDDIQLEIGKVANHYNMINNGDFSLGTQGWETPEDDTMYDIVTLSSGEKAYKLISDPENGNSLSQYFPISGTAGDIYTLSFWYKNEGVYDYDDTYVGNSVNLQFFTTEEDSGSGTWNTSLKRHSGEWQFFTEVFVADTDYSDFNVNIISIYEANSLYLTNFMLIKNLGSAGYQYDENGNLIWECDLTGNGKEYKYDRNNQLISTKTSKGNNFVYEYDNVVTDRILRGVSPTGITNESVFDDNGNVIKSIIKNVNPNNSLISGNNYYIRLKGTDKYLSYDFNSENVIVKTDSCNHQQFQLMKEDDYYRIKFGRLYLTYNSASVLFTKDNSDNSLFSIIKNSNGSYLLSPKNNSSVCLAVQNDILIYSEKEDDNYTQQFYFEDFSINKKLIREIVYDETGEYIVKEIDELKKVTHYDVNRLNGLNKSIIDANGNVTYYTYDSEDRLIKLQIDGRQKNYEYNNNDLLTKISSVNKVIDFTYDEFFRPLETKVNGNLVVRREYNAKNGNLEKIRFSNDQELTYSYNKFNNLSSAFKDGKNYNYYYNNLGALSKIESLNEIYEFAYDYAERLKECLYNNEFKINYMYDSNNNITSRRINYNGNVYNVSYTYDKNDYITKVTIDNTIIFNNNYDELGRVINSNINNNIPCEYTYYSNGESTSLILKSMKIQNDLFEYVYDNMYNIIEIYKNGIIQIKYKYDNIGELIQEINYEKSKKYNYKYDLNGNILSKKVANLDDSLIMIDNFEYTNDNWKDQLTKYNDIPIIYDNVGNMLSFGSKQYTWCCGTKLKSFNDNINNKFVEYEYDVNGLLLTKNVGELSHKYYYENGVLILEKIGDNVLYFMYDNSDNLIGFKLNDTTYYYKKNNLEDILGIYDNSYNLVVSYEYDSWGNVIAYDINGSIITDNNHIGILNPYRYRSYYYDNDLGMYWLQSRYYNPQICRFINIDSQISNDILGDNLYLYCGNNPINRSDNSGRGFFSRIICGAVVGGVIGVAAKVAANAVSGKKLNEGIIGAFVGGAVTGAIVAAPVGKKLKTKATKEFVNKIIAPVVGSFIGSTTNEIVSYTPAAKINGTTQKKCTTKNIKDSAVNVAVDTSISTVTSIAGNVFGEFVGDVFHLKAIGRPAEKICSAFFGVRGIQVNTMDFSASFYAEYIGIYLNDRIGYVQQAIVELFNW